jgi:hypothetical protein
MQALFQRLKHEFDVALSGVQFHPVPLLNGAL